MAEAALASQILVPWGWRWLLGVSALPFGEAISVHIAWSGCTIDKIEMDYWHIRLLPQEILACKTRAAQQPMCWALL